MKLRIFFVISLLLHLLFFLLIGAPFLHQNLQVNPIEVVETLNVRPLPMKPSSIKNNTKMTEKRDDKPAETPQNTEASSESTAEQPQAAVNIGTVTEAPKVLLEKRIPYPEAARRAGIEGLVEMQLVIDNQGHVQNADLLRGLGYGLDEAALQAIRGFEFSPARVGAEKVAVRIIYKYRFRLNR